MDDCLRAQERYTSQNCVIVRSPPFDVGRNSDVTQETLQFFSLVFLTITLKHEKKTCHILPGDSHGTFPSVK